MNPEPNFLTLEQVLGLHEWSLSQHGGLPGIRDQGLLESAVQAPVNHFLYANNGQATLIPELAVSYWFHLSSNHPFVDGNKRTAFAAATAFLAMNGLDLSFDEEESYSIAIQVATGQLDKDELLALILPGLFELSD